MPSFVVVRRLNNHEFVVMRMFGKRTISNSSHHTIQQSLWLNKNEFITIHKTQQFFVLDAGLNNLIFYTILGEVFIGYSEKN